MHPRRSLPRGLAALLLTSLFPGLSATAAEAGQDRWTPIGLGGGLVQSLAVDPTAPGVVYAAAGVAGIYRSDDAAQTWEWRGVPTVNLESWTSVIVAPDDPLRLYATTRPTQVSSGGVYTSGDGGLHWQELFRLRASSAAPTAAGPGARPTRASPAWEGSGSTTSRPTRRSHPPPTPSRRRAVSSRRGSRNRRSGLLPRAGTIV